MLSKARFVGEVFTTWLKGNRKMKLLANVEFIDSKGFSWLAPKNFIVDGASIPRVFWFFIGSPYSGKYRRASVIHDVYCVTKSEPRKAVNKMFYEAMRVDDVGFIKAKLMYYAVQVGAPRW